MIKENKTILPDSMHFGGVIYPSDFNTEYCSGNTAQRIASDLNFDRQCRINTELRDMLPQKAKSEE